MGPEEIRLLTAATQSQVLGQEMQELPLEVRVGSGEAPLLLPANENMEKQVSLPA